MPNKRKPQKDTDEDESTSAGKKKKKSYNVTDAAEKVSFVSISSPEVVIAKRFIWRCEPWMGSKNNLMAY